MQDQLHALIASHCNWVRAQVSLIDEELSPVVAGQSTHWHQTVLTARELTHQITGTSGTMGFPAVSVAAEALEDRLTDLGKGHMAPDKATLDELATLFGQLQELANTTSLEGSHLFGINLAEVAS